MYINNYIEIIIIIIGLFLLGLCIYIYQNDSSNFLISLSLYFDTVILYSSNFLLYLILNIVLYLSIL